MKPELDAIPRLAPGVRLHFRDQQQVLLLMPERALRLNGPSAEIVRRCDGRHNVRQIATELQALYSGSEPQSILDDLLSYLSLLQERRAMNFDL